MNFDNLQCFITLSDTLNFTKAAEKENITQTSMSRKISSLENELNVRLFYRDNKQVLLTPAGEEFYKEAVNLVKRYKIAIRKVKNTDKGLKKEINFGIGLYEQYLLKKHLSDFVKSYPEIKISCMQYQYIQLINQIEEDNLDIIFTSDQFFEKIDFEKYDVVLLNDSPWKIGINKYNSLSHDEIIKIENFHKQTLITMHDGSIDQIIDYYKKWFTVKDIVYVNSYATKLTMMSANLGIGLLPAYIKTDNFNNIIVKDTYPKLKLRKFYVLSKKDNPKLYVRYFMDMIKNNIY